MNPYDCERRVVFESGESDEIGMNQICHHRSRRPSNSFNQRGRQPERARTLLPPTHSKKCTSPALSPATIVFPFGVIAQQPKGLLVASVKMICPAGTSHTLGGSSNDIETASRPSALNATFLTQSLCPLSVHSPRPVITFHTLSVLSCDAEMACRPSAPSATLSTPSLCPLSVRNSQPVSTSRHTQLCPVSVRTSSGDSRLTLTLHKRYGKHRLASTASVRVFTQDFTQLCRGRV
jgi:hypothetical protein